MNLQIFGDLTEVTQEFYLKCLGNNNSTWLGFNGTMSHMGSRAEAEPLTKEGAGYPNEYFFNMRNGDGFYYDSNLILTRSSKPQVNSNYIEDQGNGHFKLKLNNQCVLWNQDRLIYKNCYNTPYMLFTEDYIPLDISEVWSKGKKGILVSKSGQVLKLNGNDIVTTTSKMAGSEVILMHLRGIGLTYIVISPTQVVEHNSSLVLKAKDYNLNNKEAETFTIGEKSKDEFFNLQIKTLQGLQCLSAKNGIFQIEECTRADTQLFRFESKPKEEQKSEGFKLMTKEKKFLQVESTGNIRTGPLASSLTLRKSPHGENVLLWVNDNQVLTIIPDTMKIIKDTMHGGLTQEFKLETQSDDSIRVTTKLNGRRVCLTDKTTYVSFEECVETANQIWGENMENKSCFGKGVFACSIAEEAFDGLESNPKTSMTTKIVTIAGNIASLNSKALVVISEILNAEANFLNILDNSTLEYLIDTLTKLKSEIKDGNKDTLIKSVVKLLLSVTKNVLLHNMSLKRFTQDEKIRAENIEVLKSIIIDITGMTLSELLNRIKELNLNLYNKPTITLKSLGDQAGVRGNSGNGKLNYYKH